MISEPYRIVAQDNPACRRIDVFLMTASEGLVLCQGAPTAPLDGSQYPPGPSFVLDYNAAQELMDSLWNCGIRPAEAKGSAGQLAAVERHLEDMRTLTFDGFRLALAHLETRGQIGSGSEVRRR